jgi:hypothetical protein
MEGDGAKLSRETDTPSAAYCIAVNGASLLETSFARGHPPGAADRSMLVRVLLSVVICVALLGGGMARAASPITMMADSCFSGMSPRGVFPVVIAIRNSGPSVDGAIVVRTEGFNADASRRYVYPVNLPTGTVKKVIAYPALQSYSPELRVSFVGPGNAEDIKLQTSGRYDAHSQIGLVGDQTGGLGVLAQVKKSQQPGYDGSNIPFTDCYARPEDAPDRAAGYQGLETLVLTDGAERLNPAQWAAIRQWVMMGGSLVTVGGAGAAYMRLLDAQPLLPVRDPSGDQLTALHMADFKKLAPDGNASEDRLTFPQEAVAITTGAIKPGSELLAEDNGHVVLARRSVGAGSVLFVAFNPFDKPLRGWDGQRALWTGLIHRAAPVLNAASLRAWARKSGSFDDEVYGGGRVYRGISSSPGRDVNPFHIQLPPTGRITWIFVLYFILVVPVSYIVLKRMRRLEWAWVTGPILSVIFAIVFYLFTADLYRAGMSRRTAGVLVATAGEREARFVGFSEIFLPMGGSYKVDPPNAEMLETTSPDVGSGYYGYRGSSERTRPLETIDAGTVQAPDYRAGNLSFERVYHTSPVTLDGPITARITLNKRGNLAGAIRNNTNWTLTSASVLLPGKKSYVDLPDIKPGETVRLGATVVDQERRVDTGDSMDYSYRGRYGYGVPPPQGSLRGYLASGIGARRSSSALLVASVDGVPFGPALGKYVGGLPSVSVLVSLPLDGGNGQ